MSSKKTNPAFWSSKRVLVTGHTGFKGSWLSLWLQSMGADVCGISLTPPTKPALFSEANVAEGMRHEIADIRNFDKINKIFQNFRPEVVIHLAAQPLVRQSYHDPVNTYATNIMGTIHVLEASRKANSVKAIVNVTTDKCYENREWVWGYREDDQMGGHDPYSNSKGCSELVSSAYRKSFLDYEKIPLATARAGNVIGGGDWAEDRLVPDTLKSLEKGEVVEIRNPNAIRPWQHVLEPLSGYLVLAEALYLKGQKSTGAWNFGPRDEDAKPVHWIVERLTNDWGHGTTWVQRPGNHPHEANHLKLDISKARNELGWEPQWSLKTTIEKILDWHHAWLAGENVHGKCIEQIHQYNLEELK